MPIPVGFMLALQGAGMVVDWLGKQDQMDQAKRAARLQQEAIEKAIQVSRLQTEDESLQSMVQLRKTMGSQAALFAARGIATGTPTTALVSNESLANFNADERMRRINQTLNEYKLRAGLQISQMHEKAANKQIKNEFINSVISKIPTNPAVYKKLGEDLGFGLTKA